MKDRIQKQGETDDWCGFYTTYKKYQMLFIFRGKETAKMKRQYIHIYNTDFHMHKSKMFYEKLTFLWVILHGHKQQPIQADIRWV